MRENRDHDPKASSLRAPTPRFDARSKRARRRLRLWPPDWGAILRRSPNGEVGRQRRTRARVLGRAASTVLSATEEAVIVVFRKHTRFTLDVCLAHLKPRIPALTRSLFCGPGDHVNLRGLPCGAEGIQTAMLLAMAFRITAAIRERVDGATTFAVNASGLLFAVSARKPRTCR
jgi:hypothetical protein